MHRAERRADLRDGGRKRRQCGVERPPERVAGEEAEQHLHALVIDEGVDQDLQEPREPRRRDALEVDPPDHLGEGLGRLRMRAHVRERLEIGEQHADIGRETHGSGEHASTRRGVAVQRLALDGALDHRPVHLAEQMATDAALARLTLLVHEEVLGRVELETQHLPVAPEKGEVLLHLRHFGRREGRLGGRSRGEMARLGHDRGRRRACRLAIATATAPAASRTMWSRPRRAGCGGAASPGWRWSAHAGSEARTERLEASNDRASTGRRGAGHSMGAPCGSDW